VPVELLCLDADHTLWSHESYFQDAARSFHDLLSGFAPASLSESRLDEIESRNLHIYGYGVKGFTLSMLETALEVAGDALPAATVKRILEIGRDLMRHPVAPLAGVSETLPLLAQRARLVLVTKGDLFHQEAKLAASGLGEHFEGVEIVSDKTRSVYLKIFARYGVSPERAAMVGNSLRSDVWPALEAGAYAVHIPSAFEWSHERAADPQGEARFARLAAFADLPALLDRFG
jgi:putative hydrolase of the HAD superfamily